jgi:acyl carrier protein
MEHQEIFDKVRECLVAALDVEPDEVQPKASLTEDLEAESIDFVDIIYRLEQTFQVKIPQGDLFPQDLFQNKEFVDSGAFTTAGLQVLRDKYPFLDLGGKDDLRVTELPRLYTVDMLVKYIDQRVD